MNSHALLSLATTLLCMSSNVPASDGDVIVKETLDCAKPFVESVGKEAEVTTVIAADGRLVISIVIKKDIEMRTGLTGSGYPNERFRGDFVVRLTVAPKISASDWKTMSNKLLKESSGSKEQTKQTGVDRYKLPHLHTSDYAYHIEPSCGIPLNQPELAIVEQFIVKISECLSAYDKRTTSLAVLNKIALDKY